jgi:N-hydroxyarylamine O-acetyltransferase
MQLDAYLSRIGVPAEPIAADAATLARVMAAHSRTIAFENLDVVQGKQISIEPSDVEKKLVGAGRGGYCWEQNTLLRMALEAIGFSSVVPLLCRVRWNKPDDSLEHTTTFTHMALKVTIGTEAYLADVGFAGANSMAPVMLGSSDPQALPEGQYRVVDGTHPRYSVLQILTKGEWKPLYEWRDERAALVDMECANWFSCTYPKARFTTSLFTWRIRAEDERHHILNGEYCIRKGHGVDSHVERTEIKDKAQLLHLLDSVFGIKLGSDTDGLDRYL